MNILSIKREIFLLVFFLISLDLLSQTFVEQTAISLSGVATCSVAWGDYDNDGCLDILLSGWSDSGPVTKIYHNNCNNTFAEQTGIILEGVEHSSVAWGDYDNDGDLDILLTGNNNSNCPVSKIYRNNGDNSFAEQTNILLTGVYSGSVSWNDYDNDGDLDILLSGHSIYGPITKIYRNNRNNTFTEQIGIVLTGLDNCSMTWGDYDNDNDFDILVTGTDEYFRTFSKIYRNNSDNSFSEQTDIRFAEVNLGSAAWGDYDNDGDLDILLTGNKYPYGIAKIFTNNGNNTFAEQSSIELTGVQASSAGWGDYDNDGKLDIILTGHSSAGPVSKIYHNNGNYTFTCITNIFLTGVENGSVSLGDYDNDGDLDIILAGNSGSGIVTKIFRNETILANNKPASPSNLHSLTTNGIVSFTWDKSLDSETAQNGLSYNMYVYEAGRNNYENPPHAFRQNDINNGKRLISCIGSIQWSQKGYSLKDLSPGKTYLWSVQSIDAGLQGGNFSAEQSFTMPFGKPVTQANCITFTDMQATQVSTTWANGGGKKRAVFIKAASTGIADPVDNTTYNINDITPGGWKCIYNGTENSAVLTGLAVNTVYSINVCEYNGEPGKESYLISEAYLNPVIFNTAIDVQTGISLAGVRNSSVAWGDYDNDGYLDILLTGYSGSGRVSRIYHNNGNNSFGEQTGIALTGVDYSSVAWGDYDNDGDLDILLTGATNLDPFGPVSKIYKNMGSGNFIEQTGINLAGVYYSSAAWSDFDNDGDLDILLTGNSDSGPISRLYRNNGDNSFTELAGVGLAGVYMSSAAWGDYDKDGYPDILLTGQTGTNNIARIYRNDGKNGFIDQTGISLTGVSSGSVAWGDYNNDGYLDILMTGNTGSERISKIYHNNGNNSFTELTGVVLEFTDLSSAKWIDYDNDGFLDIILAGATSDYPYIPVSKIYHNNNDDSFTEQTSFNLTKVSNSSIATGDYDNDGDQDILLTGNSLSGTFSKIYRNETLIQNTKPSVPFGLQSNWNNDYLVLRWNKASDNSTPAGAIRYNIRLGISPGGNEVRPSHALTDGKLLLPELNNLVYDTIVIFKLPVKKYFWSVQAVDINGSGGNFATEEITSADSIQANNLQAFIKTGKSILIRWKNGNGLRRALFGRFSSPSGIAKPENGVIYHAEPIFGQGDKIFNTGWYCLYNGKADSAIIFGVGEGYSYDIQVIEYTEVNGSPVYFNTTGNGNPGVFSSTLFSEQTGIILPGVMESSVEWGDYNNNGYLDIILTGHFNSATSGTANIAKIYNNNGDNSFTEESGILLTGVQWSSVAWGDYDNDCDLDLLLTGWTGAVPVSKIYRNNSDNSFTERTDIALTGVSECSVAWGDYDNDGFLDILLTGVNSSNQPVSKIYRNNGINGFAEQTSISLTGVSNGSVSWGDYDNDGDPDILMTGWTGTNAVSKIYRNNGNNSFSEQTGISLSGVQWSSAAWGDYDNDSDLDILLTGSSDSGTISRIYCNNGDNSFTWQTGISLTGVTFSSVAWGDYDNDGYLDVLLTGYNSLYQPLSKIFHNNGNNTFSENTGISLAGISDGSVIWGDYDNDGDQDILFAGYTGSTTVLKIYRNNSIMKAGNYPANIKPLAPDNLDSAPQPDGMKLYWSPINGDETGYKAMTYNVRVGNTLRGSSVLQPHSDLANGYHRLTGMGNAQLDTTFLIRNLPSGKYYWAVQAVDQGYIGGTWSDVDSFEVRNVQAFFSADTVCVGLPTHFKDLSIAFDGVRSWKWDFKDGMASTLQNPHHTFTTSGTKKVRLEILSYGGIMDSLEKDIVVKPKPAAGFSSLTVCQGTVSAIINTTDKNGLNVTSWRWDLGDGQILSVQNPDPHGYLNAGDYLVKLKATASNGCTDSIEKTVSVAKLPIAEVTTSAPLSFCKGDSVILSVSYNNMYSYQWMINGTGLTDEDSSRYVAKLSGSFTVEVVNSIGNCKTISSPVNVVVRQTPFKPGITSDNYTFGKCLGETPVRIYASQVIDGYNYQWYMDGLAIGNATLSYYEGFIPMGNYVLEADLNGCKSLSDKYNVTFADALPKPLIYAQGPSMWFLACSNDSASQYKWNYNGNVISGADKYIYVAGKNLGKYYVSIANAKGCFTMSDVMTIPTGVTGIEDISPFAGLKIYPNPTKGVFTLEMDNQIFGELSIGIITQEGKEILKIKFEKTTVHFSSQIDLSGQPKGMYIINLLIDKYSAIRKVIVE